MASTCLLARFAVVLPVRLVFISAVALVVLAGGCAADPIAPPPLDSFVFDVPAADIDVQTAEEVPAEDAGGSDAADVADVFDPKDLREDAEGGPDLPDSQTAVDVGPDAQDIVQPEIEGPETIIIEVPTCFAGACDDHNPCTTDQCINAACLYQANTATCDDGDACTTDDSCAASLCSGVTVDCDDSEPCTAETCNSATGCVSADLNGASCDDGSACTAGVCLAGDCTATTTPEVACDDGNACTQDACDLAVGCTHTALTATACDDDNLCTTDDSCNSGSCGGAVLVCDDGDPCTFSACNPASGCSFLPLFGVPCDDGDACTRDDRCATAGCEAGAAVDCSDDVTCTVDSCNVDLGCQHTAVDANCDDGLSCTSAHCDLAKGCWYSANASVCNDGNPCTDDSCDLALDCTHVANQDPCSDGDACTLADSCSETVCDGTARDCADNNPCTTDACDPLLGCVFLPAAITCTDDNVCTTADMCQNATCVGGPQLNCQDGNACTADGCTADLGCVHSLLNIGCNDGNACTNGDKCTLTGCVGPLQKSCDDSKPCTFDGCSAAVGCVSIPIDVPCTDGDACTSGDHCVGVNCVSSSATWCDDDDPCTADQCDGQTGCIHIAGHGACNDGNPCSTGDTCLLGKCKPGPATPCNDNNPCTVDSCNSLATVPSPCVYTATPGATCDDGNNCTASSACDGSLCKGSGTDCSDGNACTADSCSQSGCVHTTITCTDNNTCTSDSCVTATGCKFTVNNAVSCDDNNPCTTSTTCNNSGACVGTAVVCNDNNPCTSDSCSTTFGCIYNSLQSGSCSDNSKCTTGDACKFGVCTGAATLNCDDGNACTADSCSAIAGCVHNSVADWTPCGAEDSNMACSGGGSCANVPFNRLMAIVPSGTMALGCNPSVDAECQSDESPQRLTTVSAYWLDMFEVTVASYKQCVTAGVCAVPGNGNYFIANNANHPVNFVSHSDAYTYCNWVDKRLPTEAEWEKASRGGCDQYTGGTVGCQTKSQKFPWGNEAANCDLAVFDGNLGLGCGAYGTWDVGGTGVTGPYLHFDMAGNVAEWVADTYSATWYSTNSNWTNPTGPATLSSHLRVVRGGGWSSSAAALRSSDRASAAYNGKASGIGFRCARSWAMAQ